jgi:gamma-glutamyltranspeptidase/glutathione hydrolase
MDPQQAVSRAHVGNRNGPTELEAGTDAEDFREPLEALGHEVRIDDMNSGVHLIAITRDGTLMGGADPRREGIALGD